MTAPRKKKPTRADRVVALVEVIEDLEQRMREAQSDMSAARTTLWGVMNEIRDLMPEAARSSESGRREG